MIWGAMVFIQATQLLLTLFTVNHALLGRLTMQLRTQGALHVEMHQSAFSDKPVLDLFKSHQLSSNVFQLVETLLDLELKHSGFNNGLLTLF